MDKNSKIFVAGHGGLVGSAILRNLIAKGYSSVVVKTHGELDLIVQQDVFDFFEKERFDAVFLAAAFVGGIGANSSLPAHFIYRNMMIGFNVVEAARKFGVKKLMNLGSTCIYPKMASQPITEEALLTGPLEPTNDAYALAKISVIKLCTSYNKQFGTNFLSAMPTNLYGIGDNYDLQGSHVLPAMIRKFHEAKISQKDEVELWGDGTPLREFLFADDLAEATVFLMENYSAADLRNEAGDFVNLGSGKELTIAQLAQTIEKAVYADCPQRRCKILWNTAMPNGTPRKLCDVSRVEKLGWQAKTSLEEGIKIAYEDFKKRYTK